MFAKDLAFDDDDDDDDVSASTSDHFVGRDRDDISLNLQLSTSCRDEKAAAKEGRGPKRRQQLDIRPDIIIDIERLIRREASSR